jgi:DNA-binding transcriptional MocR family regulator
MDLQAPAAAAGAIILPGDLFYPGYTANVPGGRNGIRLSFSSVDEAAIQKGIGRLGKIFREASQA